MDRVLKRLALTAAAALLFAGLALGESQVTRVESFRLPDQHGHLTEIAPSDRATLVFFYQGDW